LIPLTGHGFETAAILVTELSRWGRSTQDLVQTLDNTHSYAAFRIMPRRLAFVQIGERRQRGMSA
jgi:hypothetical protein